MLPPQISHFLFIFQKYLLIALISNTSFFFGVFLVLCEETYESLLQTRKDYLYICNLLRLTKDHCASFYFFLLFWAQDFSVQDGILLSTFEYLCSWQWKGLKYTHAHALLSWGSSTITLVRPGQKIRQCRDKQLISGKLKAEVQRRGGSLLVMCCYHMDRVRCQLTRLKEFIKFSK